MYTSSTDETSFEMTSAVFANRTGLQFIVSGSHSFGNTGIGPAGGNRG
jgi:hypothetical protein